MQSPKTPEQIQTPGQIQKNPRETVVIEACPDTPTPLPRQDHGNKPQQQQRLDAEAASDAPQNGYARSKIITTRPIIRYVDSGVDAMSSVGNFAGDGLKNARDEQSLPARRQYTEQATFHAPYYNPAPAHMPYSEPTYWANGTYEHAGLQSSSDWSQHVPLHYPSQHLYSVPMQPEVLDYGLQNNDSSYLAPTSDMYPVPFNDLNEYMASSPVHESEPVFRPDEETKAFWRPNFLR